MNHLATKFVNLTRGVGDALERVSEYVDTGYDFGQNTTMGNSSKSTQSSPAEEYAGHDRFMLWIDGVGAYLICLGERVSIGGPPRAAQSADVALLANLSGRHATVIRDGEGYLLQAHAPARVAARNVDARAFLNDGYEIELGTGVKFRFGLPMVLSMTATIDFLSDHRPALSVDGVILMDETCLLGPGSENHIRCRGWDESILLFRRDGKFYCKSRGDIFLDGHMLSQTTPLVPGQVVTGLDFSFRIEALERPVSHGDT